MFLFSSLVVVAAVAGIAQAQTPQGFKPSVDTKLDVMFNSTAVNTPGQQLTKQATATQPMIAVSQAALNGTGPYVFVMLDLDVPPEQGNTTRRVLLHVMNTGFKASQQKIGGNAVLLTSTDKGPATYIGPSPPATDTMPHRYVEMLFAQPANLQVQATDFANTQSRIGFDINSFAAKNKLGTPLAANFFTVDGKANAAASGKGTATASGGIAKNTLQPFEGAAGRVDLPLGLAGLLGGLALAVV